MNIRLHNINPIGSNKCEKVWGLKKSGEPIRVWTPCMGWGKRCTAGRSALLLLICLASASSEVKRDTCTHAGVWDVWCLPRTLNEPECPLLSSPAVPGTKNSSPWPFSRDPGYCMDMDGCS
jgi:hypothetical protein